MLFRSLARATNGALVSCGLGFLIGQELELAPSETHDLAQMGRIAVRLIDALVHIGPLAEPQQLIGPDGEKLFAVPRADGGRLLVTVER